MKMKVLATSTSLDGLKKLLAEYWFQDPNNFDFQEGGIITKKDKIVSVTWRKKGKRYQLVREE